MGTIADKITYLDGTKEAIHDAIVAKGITIDSGATFRSYATSIAEISTGSPTLPDLVAGGTYRKQDGTPVVISAISGETTAIRLLAAATGPMKTALVLTFTGSPVIDWGDGTTTSPTSNVAAVHQYDGINPIPCGRAYGVYLITITGGTVTAIASSSSRDDWGSAIGNIVSVAFKSSALNTIANLMRSASNGAVQNYLTEEFYADAPITAFSLAAGCQYRKLYLKSSQLASFSNWVPNGICAVINLDLSNVRVNGDLTTMNLFFSNATSILFNPANTELGNIHIQYNSLSVAALVALFNSLPTVTAKTIQIGGSAAALALTTAQLAIATNKGWTVTRTY